MANIQQRLRKRGAGMVNPFPQYTIPPLTNLWGWWNSLNAYTDDGTTLCSNSGVDVCKQLTDLSGNSRHLTQGTAGYRPTWYSAQQNGYPALRFDRSDDFMSKSSETLAQPLTMYCVGKNNFPGYSGVFIGGSDSSTNTPSRSTLFLTSTAPNYITFSAGSSVADLGTTASNSYFMAMGVANGASSFSIINTSAPVSLSGTGSLGNTTLSIGAYSDGTFLLGGDIVEILIFSQAHSSSAGEGLAVRQYLNQKYALGLSL